MPLPGLDLRDDVRELTDTASDDLALLWRQVRNATEAETALRDILPALIDTYGSAAGTLAANWYDDLRDKVGPRGRFIAIPADIKDSGAQALIGWSLDEATDYSAFQSLVVGGTQRRVTNFSRATLTGSSAADPASVGWKRIGGGECEFCQMLISRDQLYSEATADFASHDHCKCSAYPLIKGAEPIRVKDYVKSTRNITDADRARVRAYIASH